MCAEWTCQVRWFPCGYMECVCAAVCAEDAMLTRACATARRATGRNNANEWRERRQPPTTAHALCVSAVGTSGLLVSRGKNNPPAWRHDHNLPHSIQIQESAVTRLLRIAVRQATTRRNKTLVQRPNNDPHDPHTQGDGRVPILFKRTGGGHTYALARTHELGVKQSSTRESRARLVEARQDSAPAASPHPQHPAVGSLLQS
jgi:hypothetical protein